MPGNDPRGLHLKQNKKSSDYSGSTTTVRVEKDPLAPSYAMKNCDAHSPSKGSPTVAFKGGNPEVVFSQEAYQNLLDWARCFDIEVSVFGRVERDKWRFYIPELYFPKQEGHGATTEPSMEDLADWLRANNRENEIISNDKWLFWGHFHPGGSCSPSGQDDTQMRNFDGAPFFIRGIFSRTGGSAEFLLVDSVSGLEVNKMAWSYETCPARPAEEIEREVASKVYKIGYATNYGGTSYYQGSGNHGQSWDYGRSKYHNGPYYGR